MTFKTLDDIGAVSVSERWNLYDKKGLNNFIRSFLFGFHPETPDGNYLTLPAASLILHKSKSILIESETGWTFEPGELIHLTGNSKTL